MAHSKAVTEALRRVPFLATLSESERSSLVPIFKTTRVEPETALFREQQAGDSLHIVVVGEFRVCVNTPNGEQVVARIRPGDVVGEMACVDPGLRSASVVADKRSITLELDRNTLQALYAHMPRAAVAITSGVISTLTQRIRATNQRIVDDLRTNRIKSEAETPKLPSPASTRAESKAHAGRIDLRTVPCLKAFSDDQLKTLLQIAPPKSYRTGTVLCREGAVGDGCFILVQGEVEVYRHTAEGEQILAKLPGGSMVGQMALVDAAKRSASVRTISPSVILAFQRADYARLLNSVDPLAVRFQEQIAVAGIRQLRSATARLRTLLQAPPRRGPKPPTRPQGSTPEARPSRAPITNASAKLPRPKTPRAPAPTPRPPTSSGPLHPALMKRPVGGQSEEQRYAHMMSFMQTALDDWDMNLDQLDDISVTRATGEMSAAERKLRTKK